VTRWVGSWACAMAGGMGVACAASRPAVFPTRTADVGAERRAPGIVIDPPTHTPPPQSSASTSQALIVLQPPLDADQAVRVVRRFFEAVTQEQLDVLRDLFDPSGRLWAGRQMRPLSLEAAWARRIDQLDYTALASSTLYREADLEVYRGSEARGLAEARDLPRLPQQSEVLVRVTLAVTSAGTDRLFGDQVVFLLRPSEGGYKISEIREDFRLP
jgi:hypothetical protein